MDNSLILYYSWDYNRKKWMVKYSKAWFLSSKILIGRNGWFANFFLSLTFPLWTSQQCETVKGSPYRIKMDGSIVYLNPGISVVINDELIINNILGFIFLHLSPENLSDMEWMKVHYMKTWIVFLLFCPRVLIDRSWWIFICS